MADSTIDSRSGRRRALLLGNDSGRDALFRIKVAFAALAFVFVVGTVGYLLLGFSLLEAIYQTVTTVATVGFREVQTLSSAGMVFTIVLIVVGVGTVLYNLGVLVEAVTEGHLREYLGRLRMSQAMAQLRGHVIIVGFGRVGRAAAQRLLDQGYDVVLLDHDATRLEGVTAPYVVGDASQDDTLRAAGIDRARAVICALDNDAATMYATLSARSLRPDIVIISRARTVDSKDKLMLAGATRAVNPQISGGWRMAAFALHADVAEFLDQVMHDEEIAISIEQVRIPADSAMVGRSLGELDVTSIGVQLLAVRLPRKGAFVPVPPASMPVEVGMTLIVFGDTDHVARLRSRVG